MPPIFSIILYQRSQQVHPQPSQDNLIPSFLRTTFESMTFSIIIQLALILIFFIYFALVHLFPKKLMGQFLL